MLGLRFVDGQDKYVKYVNVSLCVLRGLPSWTWPPVLPAETIKEKKRKVEEKKKGEKNVWWRTNDNNLSILI